MADGMTAGWRAQPVALKLLLFASVAALAVGVIRCSMESTAPVSADISVIGVSGVAVVGVEEALGAPPEALARDLREEFVRSLEKATGVAAVATDDTTRRDVTVRLRLRPWEGQLRLTGEVVEGTSGRLMGVVRVEGPLEAVEGMARAAAYQTRRALRLDEELPGD